MQTHVTTLASIATIPIPFVVIMVHMSANLEYNAARVNAARTRTISAAIMNAVVLTAGHIVRSQVRQYSLIDI